MSNFDSDMRPLVRKNIPELVTALEDVYAGFVREIEHSDCVWVGGSRPEGEIAFRDPDDGRILHILKKNIPAFIAVLTERDKTRRSNEEIICKVRSMIVEAISLLEKADAEDEEKDPGIETEDEKNPCVWVDPETKKELCMSPEDKLAGIIGFFDPKDGHIVYVAQKSIPSLIATLQAIYVTP